jgi:hypothetical protein
MGLTMAEPATTTLATAAAVATATAFVPGVDGNALIGAIAGGALFVTGAKDLPLWQRALYLVASPGVGYLAAPDVAERLALHSTGLAAFLAAALAVTITARLVAWAGSLDLSKFLPNSGG